MFKCPIVSLLEDFSFISFRPILASLVPSMEVCCLSLWFTESAQFSAEPSTYFSILELALLYFWVPELKEISSDKSSPGFMSQILRYQFAIVQIQV